MCDRGRPLSQWYELPSRSESFVLMSPLAAIENANDPPWKMFPCYQAPWQLSQCWRTQRWMHLGKRNRSGQFTLALWFWHPKNQQQWTMSWVCPSLLYKFFCIDGEILQKECSTLKSFRPTKISSQLRRLRFFPSLCRAPFSSVHASSHGPRALPCWGSTLPRFPQISGRPACFGHVSTVWNRNYNEDLPQSNRSRVKILLALEIHQGQHIPLAVLQPSAALQNAEPPDASVVFALTPKQLIRKYSKLVHTAVTSPEETDWLQFPRLFLDVSYSIWCCLLNSQICFLHPSNSNAQPDMARLSPKQTHVTRMAQRRRWSLAVPVLDSRLDSWMPQENVFSDAKRSEKHADKHNTT